MRVKKDKSKLKINKKKLKNAHEFRSFRDMVKAHLCANRPNWGAPRFMAWNRQWAERTKTKSGQPSPCTKAFGTKRITSEGERMKIDKLWKNIAERTGYDAARAQQYKNFLRNAGKTQGDNAQKRRRPGCVQRPKLQLLHKKTMSGKDSKSAEKSSPCWNNKCKKENKHYLFPQV